ncbi:MAG: DUF1501 domain-containing protein, partial [Verrucomicrobiota bacterium]
TIPELMTLAGARYTSAAFGKWHLGNETNGGPLAPNVAGFEHYDGCLLGSLQPPPGGVGYYNWPRTVNGVRTTSTTYATTATVNSALTWILDQTEPWLCMVSFNAPHLPLHEPPAGLYHEDLTGLAVLTSPRPFYKAAIEAIDTELGRLLAALGEMENTLVVWATEFGRMPFLQGNGTGRDHNPDAFTCFFAGAGVKKGFSYGQSDEFGFKAEVNPVEVYDFNATILHLMGLDHERLSYYHNGLERRLTNVHGHVIKDVLG